jgi:hypothetical protein
VKELGPPTRGAGSFFGGSDGFAACVDTVSVKVQKSVSGHWRTIKSTTTSSTGGYRTHLFGGAGNDSCKGGPGKDTEKSCQR